MNNNKLILVVEDDAILLKALHEKLSHEGFSFLEARDGEQGLALALEKHPDLILLDMIMPKMDGMTFLNKLREDDWGKKVPVIILTNLSDEEKVQESMQHNVFDYLIKTNWTLDDVVQKIQKRLHMSY